MHRTFTEETLDENQEFEWDEDKRLENLRKHKVDFQDAAHALLGKHLSASSPRYGEDRTIAVAKVDGRVIAVVFTERNGRCRLISARAARSYEREKYHKAFSGSDP